MSSCSLCLSLLEKLSLLERRVRQLEGDKVSLVTVDTTGTPDSIATGSISSPVSASSPCSASHPNVVVPADGEFVLVPKSKSARRRLPSLVRPDSQPLAVVNRFSPLASPLGRPCHSASPDRSSPRTLVIGDSITRGIRLATPATVTCLPGARAPDIEANLRVLANNRRSHKGKAHNKHTSFDNIVIHVGTNDVRMRQSEVTKSNIARTCDLARKMCRHRLIISGPLPVRGNDERYSRLVSLNRWLSQLCADEGFSFVDNWPSFWGRPGLLKADGLHPTGHGAAIISGNIDRCLRQE